MQDHFVFFYKHFKETFFWVILYEESFFARSVIVDESWIRHYVVGIKMLNEVWKYGDLSIPKKFKVNHAKECLVDSVLG